MSDSPIDNRELCKYGVDCYQKNSEHHRKYRHPKRKSEEPEGISEINKKQTKVEEAIYHQSKSNEVEIGKKEDARNKQGIIENNSENVDLEALPSDMKDKMRALFLVDMPEDFYSFFEFCKHLDNNNPHKALEAVGIHLVGPFDLFREKLKTFTRNEALRHYRYYYDPPEFQTVLKCEGKNHLHYGYFRDDPKELPVFIASNEATVGCKINIESENLFSVVNVLVEKSIKTADPFKKMKIKKIQQELTRWSQENQFILDTVTKGMKERRSKVITKTFHGAGIVVPYNKKSELGYRELQENNSNLKIILKKLTEADSDEERTVYWGKLQPVITAASIANDEFDFGTGLELGIDLFCFGDSILQKTALRILSTTYELLERSDFAIILKAHLDYRKKGIDLNTIVM